MTHLRCIQRPMHPFFVRCCELDDRKRREHDSALSKPASASSSLDLALAGAGPGVPRAGLPRPSPGADAGPTVLTAGAALIQYGSTRQQIADHWCSGEG